MKTKMVLLFALVLVFSITGVNAQNKQYSRTQQERIKNDYRNGKHTPAEASRLAHQQKIMQKDIRRTKCNDGRIGRSEKARNMRQKHMGGREMYSYNHQKRNRF